MFVVSSLETALGNVSEDINNLKAIVQDTMEASRNTFVAIDSFVDDDDQTTTLDKLLGMNHQMVGIVDSREIEQCLQVASVSALKQSLQ